MEEEGKDEIKMILIGDTNVGKSCIASRFVNQNFPGQIQATVGAAYLSKEYVYEDKTYNVNLWDTAGQEKYHYLVPMYYRNAEVVFLVFDLSRDKTFSGLQKWVDEVHQSVPQEVPLVLVGNKADLDTERQVCAEDAQTFAEINGAMFFEVSALTGDGISKLFETTLQSYLSVRNAKVSDNPKPLPIADEKKNKGCC